MQENYFDLPDLQKIRQSVSAHSAAQYQVGEKTRQASVAVILRSVSNQKNPVEVLFIKRSDRPNDAWSGQMAFPGGHLDVEDNSLLDAAIRETREEIGLDLEEKNYIGDLDQQRAVAKGAPLDMLIAPFVFHIDGNPQFTPNYEVADVVWAPLNEMILATNHSWEEKHVRGTTSVFNGYRLSEQHFVWGLTYRMIKSMFTVINPQWRAPVEKA